MQTCGNCKHWQCTINFYCGCKKSSFFNEKRVAKDQFCAWWQGKKEDHNYDLKAINTALEPLGLTFEQLFRLRYSELFQVELEIKRKQASFWQAPWDQVDKLKKEEKDLEDMREILIYGRRVKPCKE